MPFCSTATCCVLAHAAATAVNAIPASHPILELFTNIASSPSLWRSRAGVVEPLRSGSRPGHVRFTSAASYLLDPLETARLRDEAEGEGRRRRRRLHDRQEPIVLRRPDVGFELLLLLPHLQIQDR